MDARIGLWTGSLDGTPAAAIPEIVGALEEQGWSSLWFGEAYGREAFTAANLLLSASGRMRVGTGIANIWGRDAVACAAAARTLHAVHDARFVLGLGISHAPLVERLRGGTYDKPVATMAAYLDALASTSSIVPGEADLPPVLIAALGPRMLQLAAGKSDGAHPYLVTPEQTASAREVLGAGPRLVVEQACVVADVDEDEWRRRAHEHLNIYTGLPNYRNSFLRQGFEESDLGRGGSERLKRAMVARGIDATAAVLEQHLAAGADEVLLQVLGPDVMTAPVDDWARLAVELP